MLVASHREGCRGPGRVRGPTPGAVFSPGLALRAMPQRTSRLAPLALVGALGCIPTAPAEDTTAPAFRVIERLESPGARQAVAVDADHVYAIDNRRIEKLDRRSGRRVAFWEGEAGGPIVHLNSGVVLDGVLHCAHSNYPALPMRSSIERFDAATLRHLGTQRLGNAPGSATWVGRWKGHWWVAFAHYAGRGGEPGKGPEFTSLVRFDAVWRPQASFAYPPELIERFAGRSNSGGAWGADGRLYLTGHDAGEIYVVRVPRAGSVLALVEIVEAPIEGQGIAWDPARPGVLWGVLRNRQQLVALRRGGS